MVLVLKKDTDPQKMDALIAWLRTLGLEINCCVGKYRTILGLIGDVTPVDVGRIQSMEIVESVKQISEPYTRVSRRFHSADTVVEIGGVSLGGGHFQLIAGPCSVESSQQICEIAGKVRMAGATLLRGGAFKPRTSPYAFQGLGVRGIELLLEAKRQTGLPIVTEIVDVSHLKWFDAVDVIQVGARNMQNFELLKALGALKKPILLKRGMANTLQEFLMSAEYIMAGGNEQVILCERGIRTFETAVRNTLDLSAVPLLKEMSHLPIIVDPSHATGIARLVQPMALAAVAAGADGLLIEVHNDPACALCDGEQSLTTEQFETLSANIARLLPVMRSMQ